MNNYLGIDIGSISVNTVILNEELQVIQEYYDYCHGHPFKTLLDRLESVLKSEQQFSGKIAATGTGGRLASDLLNGTFVNEIIAQSVAVSKLFPRVKTIIEMGGEDSKLIFLDKGSAGKASRLSDFNLNNLCAAGTGSFLDQQAKRMGLSIENEFGELALKSRNPPRIAGRCSVFAKSDMIHLQQIATPMMDIAAGLCFAVARNFKSTLGRGKNLELPIIFQGGVAANVGMIRAFKEIYDIKDGEMIIPEHYASMGAIGAVMHASENGLFSQTEISIDKLRHYLTAKSKQEQHLEKLIDKRHVINKEVFPINNSRKVEAYLGIDVGSLSTNLALIDKDNHVLARRYLPTASKPLNAIQQGLKEINEEVGKKIDIKAVGTTGSGRYLTGDFVGADIIQNEITAQATAAISIDPEVDTIFEIGGQDSKFIRISNGVIIDFEMNKVCAAGTGSFLEEQADKLGINIVEEFGELGLKSEMPAKLGERCTVFMESDLNTKQQQGLSKENLIAGLSYSIVYNYLNRVVRDKPVGDRIFFQGGVTNNKAVVAAFENVTGKKITIPPHFDITGAIGAAILARESMKNGDKSSFKGFHVSETKYKTDRFTCKHCANYCEIKRVKFFDKDSKPLFYGGICERYEKETRKSIKIDLPNLFEKREEMLLNGHENNTVQDKISIGLPRGLMNYYQHFPFWKTFFSELGFNLILSDETDRQIITDSLETMVSETCLPVELIHGHVINLLEKNADYIFLPFIVNSRGEKENPTNNCNCPWVQSHPYLLKAAFTDEKIREKMLIPSLHFRYFDKALRRELQDFFTAKFDLNRNRISRAIDEADKAQDLFELQIRLKGEEVFGHLNGMVRKVVILGRAYNTGDPMLNLRLVKKLLNMNVLPIPIDFLPLHKENIFDDYPGMYWPNGQKILKASRIIARHKDLFAVYLSNFRCGPDSFLLHFVRMEMEGKPFLHLEVDEHSADAGMITRIEAFMDSLKGWEANHLNDPVTKRFLKPSNGHAALNGRTIYFPYARDAVHILSAATRSCGIRSEVLPMQTEEDVELGRKYTNGQECFPAICTTGSFLKKLMEPGIDPKKASFFMPDHNGPCRFGEYNKLHRIIFDNLGFKDAEIVHPSNEDAYASIAPGYSLKWRKNAWKGIIASDLLRKMLEQVRPYEKIKGTTDKIYQNYLDKIIYSVENNCKDLNKILKLAARNFKSIGVENPDSRPVVAIVGEIFMRDNPFCSNFLVKRLEDLGAETLMAPFAEWVNYSTIRFIRDSRWKGNIKNLFKARLQLFFQKSIEKMITGSIQGIYKLVHEVEVEEMLESCGEYINRDYDGDPPLAIGSTVLLAEKRISGVVNILPFTCMPGTINCTVSQNLRKEHGGLPWENFAYDGQENVGTETRFEAFMYQVKKYAENRKLVNA
jgi:predicted CoA-substrate-specific enzyme activase